MNAEEVVVGMWVKVGDLGTTTGMLVKSAHLDVRKKGVSGIVLGVVLGHGGDVWWVQHDNTEDIGAYTYTELNHEPAHMTRMQLISDT